MSSRTHLCCEQVSRKKPEDVLEGEALVCQVVGSMDQVVDKRLSLEHGPEQPVPVESDLAVESGGCSAGDEGADMLQLWL